MTRNKLLLPCVIVFSVLAGMAEWKIANTVPTVSLPPQKMPSPNAYDTFIRAGKMLKQTGYLDAWSPADQALHPTQSQKQEIVEDNARALREFRIGMSQRYLHPPHDPYTNFTEVRPFGRLGQLLAWESQVNAGRGKIAEAISSCLDLIEFADQLPKGRAIGEDYPSWRILERMGQIELCKHVDDAPRDVAAMTVSRMEQMAKKKPDFVYLLTEGKTAQQLGLLRLFEGRKIGYSDVDRLSQQTSKLPAYIKKKAMVDVTHYYDEAIENVRRTYPMRRKAILPSDSKNSLYAPADPLIALAAPWIYPLDWYDDVLSQARSDLLMTAFALRAYNLDHHLYPISLQQLTPTYLRVVPGDPFAVNSPLRYNLIGNKYILYSLGPDGKDDGGKQAGVLVRTKTGEMQYRIEPNSKGDIVAGIGC